MQFEGLPEGAQTTGMPPGLIYTLTELYPDHVVLDGNHPLAGMALQLALKVVAVRAATDDELARGSVSDEGPVSLLSTQPAPPHLH
jgi:FKBP-type peptidyl-prolyl cis-trans isomerase SlyD